MTDAAKITRVQVLVEHDPDATAETIAVYLDQAHENMLEQLYPNHPEKTVEDIPDRYDGVQCELAARYFLRRGGQGEINHEENGVNRQYGSVDDSDILNKLLPFAKVGG